MERGVSESEARRLYHDVLRDEKASTEAGTWTEHDRPHNFTMDPTDSSLIQAHHQADRQPSSKLSGIYGPGSEEREKRCAWRYLHDLWIFEVA